VSRPLRLLVAPLALGLTCRRFVHLLLGAVEVRGPTDAVPRLVSREAYRIVQEGLTNALRHAGPVPVAVRVTVGPDVLELELTNPLGAHGSSRTGGGRGLDGMRERVHVLRGDLVAGSGGSVWRVVARLPLRGSEMMAS
jgi:signal transduction histidine kinase